jgi:hypothetical protein
MNKLIISVILLTFSTLSYAIDCSERELTDDFYDNFPEKKITSKHAKEVSGLIDNLIGDWKGSVTISECKGQIKVTNGTVETSLLKKNTKTYIKRTRFQFDGKKSSRIDDLLLTDNVLSYDQSENGFVIHEKSRRTNQRADTSYIFESIHKATLINNRLTLNIEYFVNGQLSAHEIWNLVRD